MDGQMDGWMDIEIEEGIKLRPPRTESQNSSMRMFYFDNRSDPHKGFKYLNLKYWNNISNQHKIRRIQILKI